MQARNILLSIHYARKMKSKPAPHVFINQMRYDLKIIAMSHTLTHCASLNISPSKPLNAKDLCSRAS